MANRKVIVGNVCKLNSSTIGSTNSPKTIYYLDTSNITKNRIDQIQFLDSEIIPFPSRAKRKVKKGTIIYSTVRPNLEHYGFLENPLKNLIVSTGFTTIDVIDKDVHSRFLYYSLTRKHITDYLHTIATNNVSAYPSLNPDDIGKLELVIPKDYEVQKKIASVLSNLDAKIELNNRIIRELEQMAKLLYDYWFVQFDFPDANGKPYKSSGGKMVWNKELKREIPEGWKVKSLSSFCAKIGDGIHGTPDYVNLSDYKFINGNNLDNGFIKIDENTKNVSFEEYKKYFIELNEGTILLSINGTLGNLAVYTGEKVMLGKSAAYINCKGKNRPYCYQYMKLEHIQRKFWSIATGSTIKNLSLESLNNLLLPFPGDDLIIQFYNLIEPIDNKRKNIFNQNHHLTTLRDWLLPMLMNGQVRVGEAGKKEYQPNEAEMDLAAEPGD